MVQNLINWEEYVGASLHMLMGWALEVWKLYQHPVNEVDMLELPSQVLKKGVKRVASVKIITLMWK